MSKFFLILFISLSAQAQDFGTGADGVCNISGASLKTEWNCTDATITGTPTFLSSSNGIIIRATGDIIINGTLRASASASTGTHSSTSTLGGGNGGTCTTSPCTSPATKAPGSLGGEGAGGSTGTDNASGDDAGGGGGAGGTYNSTNPGASGSTGSVTGIGATAGAGGAQNTTGFGSEANFATTISGGVGGGAGGTSEAGFSTNYGDGGDGGAGGGIIQLFAKGKIENNGTIEANGAKGNPGTTNSGSTGGSGGGGSGGSIFIYTATSFSNLNPGAISAVGGLSTAGVGNGGAGGAGGHGRIRIDTASGSFTNTGTITPNPVSFVATKLPSSVQEFSSSISQDCSLVKVNGDEFNYSFIYGLLLMLSISFIPLKLKKQN